MKGEVFNGAVHMAAVVIVAPMLAYNAKEYAIRREPRNALNAVVYTFALGFEIWNTFGHWRWGDA